MALARLGERFTDIHKSGVRGAAGTGLGLSLAFSLAKLHGGALTFSSAPGEGTIARLDLPVRKTLAEMSEAGLSGAADIQSQLDRVAQYRRERGARNAA
jgi:signal transduction histidine kinase